MIEEKLIGTKVFHNVYGEGIIIEHENNKVRIQFETEFETKLFPDNSDRVFFENGKTLKSVIIRVEKKQETTNGSIANALNKRNIRDLYHFTNVENLKSIMTNGILPVTDLVERGIGFLFNDQKRCDGCEDCICVSIEYPNTRNLKKFIEKDSKSEWVIFRIDSNVLLNQNNFYAQHNASTNGIRESIRNSNSPDDFEEMFADVVLVPSKGYRFDRKWFHQRNNLPTSDQAEVLVQGIIRVESIREILFFSQNELDKHNRFVEGKEIPLSVKPSMFIRDRNDYFGLW